jgi:hypothetical protein
MNLEVRGKEQRRLEAEDWGGHIAVQQFLTAVLASLYTVVVLQSGS